MSTLLDAGSRADIRDVIASYAEHTVTLESHVAPTDGYPDATFSAPVSYAANVSFNQQEVRTAAGDQVVAAGTCLFAFPGPPAISADDRLRLPDGKAVRILKVERDFSADPYVPTRVQFG